MQSASKVALSIVFGLCCFASVSHAASYYSYPYLYGKEGNDTFSYPVHDHIAPTGDQALRRDRPDFLYRPNNSTYRVVEFYVHWCGICRHYSTHYVKLARTMTQLLAEKKDGVQIEFHAISCVPNRLLCLKQETPGYPLVRLFAPGATKGKDLIHTDAKMTTIFQYFGMRVDNLDALVEEEEEWTVSSPNDAPEQASFWSAWFSGGASTTNPFVKGTREDLRNDIHLSFDFAMRNSVYMTADRNKLSDEAKASLFEFLTLLDQTIPAAWSDFRALLHTLLLNFKYVSKNEKYLVKFLNKHPPKGRSDEGEYTWSPSCSLGEPGSGYTCGLWKIFHTMTVGVVGYNLQQISVDELVPTEKAALTIRNFIDHFFQCSECRRNFLEMYERCDHDRCNRLKETAKLGNKENETVEQQVAEWQQLPLWLFEVHNAVNVRLATEKAARGKHELSNEEMMAATWPPIPHCQPCWANRTNANLGWNETTIIQYLTLEYGQRDHALDDFQRTLVASQTETTPVEPVADDLQSPTRSTAAWVLVVCATCSFLATKKRRTALVSLASRLGGKDRTL